MTDFYCHPEDAHIERIGDVWADLYDCDGNQLGSSFPADWTDEQIMKALDFANYAYAKGVAAGKRRKAQEIRMALEVSA